MDLEFNITNQTLKRTDRKQVVNESIQYLRLNFTFNTEWDTYTDRYVFYRKGGKNYEYPITDNKATVPYSFLHGDRLIFGVYGVISDENETITHRITTNPLMIPLVNSGLDVEFDEIDETVKETLTEMITSFLRQHSIPFNELDTLVGLTDTVLEHTGFTEYDWETLQDTSITEKDYGTILTKVIIPKGITSLPEYCFYQRPLPSINLNDVTTLGTYCFTGAGLTSIDLTNVTSIGDHCFYGCLNLETATLGPVTSLGQNCFRNCQSLTSIVIPETVTLIGASCFQACRSLESITFTSEEPPEVSNSNAWTNLPITCVIRVPEGTLEAYTTADKYPNPDTYTYEEYEAEQ